MFRGIKRLNEANRTPKFQSSKDQPTYCQDNYQRFHFSIGRQPVQQNDQSSKTITINSKYGNLRRLSQSRRKLSQLKSNDKQRQYLADNIFEENNSNKPTTTQGLKNASDYTKKILYLSKRQAQILLQQNQKEEQERLNVHPNANCFNKLMVIGKGGFGRVWKVVELRSRRIFAMKVMEKSKIFQKKSIFSVMNERQLLAQVRHPFLVNMRYAFQDSDRLYLVMDYCNRGDMRYHLIQMRTFKEHQTRFFLACLVLCLEYIHSREIIHRDLKPQNLVLDDKGYVKVMDLGISRPFIIKNGRDTSGTPGYMAPEVLFRRNHSYCVDFYALGVIGFEFMTGSRPYTGLDRSELRHMISIKQVQLTSPLQGWSVDSVDFINRLIQRKSQNRLGFNGIDQIKSHPFFKDIDWQSLYQKEIISPFIPKTIEEDYSNYRRGIPAMTENQNSSQISVNYDLNEARKAFTGYEYDGNWAIIQKIPLSRASPCRKIRSQIK